MSKHIPVATSINWGEGGGCRLLDVLLQRTGQWGECGRLRNCPAGFFQHCSVQKYRVPCTNVSNLSTSILFTTGTPVSRSVYYHSMTVRSTVLAINTSFFFLLIFNNSNCYVAESVNLEKSTVVICTVNLMRFARASLPSASIILYIIFHHFIVL